MTSNEHSIIPSLSEIDKDLRDLHEFPIEQRMEFLTDLIFEWEREYGLRDRGVNAQYPPFSTQERYLQGDYACNELRKPRSDGIRFSVLPDTPHPLDHGKDINTIRDVGLAHPNFYKSDADAVFIPVQQGYMVEVPAELEQFYHMSMSTCSCIVGYGADRTFVAHIYYSIEMEAQQVLDHMIDNGVKPEDIYVVASQTPGVDSQMGLAAVTDADYYTERGIPRDNIHEFIHTFQNGKEDVVGVSLTPEAIRIAKYRLSHDEKKNNSKRPEPYEVDVVRIDRK